MLHPYQMIVIPVAFLDLQHPLTSHLQINQNHQNNRALDSHLTIQNNYLEDLVLLLITPN